MIGRNRGRMMVGLFGAALVVAACGGGGDGGSFKPPSSDASDTMPSSGTDDTDAPSRPSGGGINDKQDVSAAVVQIVASGSFRDIAEGTMAGDWTGTGFIISSDGLVVTNQHVVEGAGSLDVYLEGEDRPKNAKILGVSECNDLAVIDLEGDGYPYLDWYEGDVEPGIDVWVAGFPLGDPEYTLTRGSITKAEASGDSSWASIDYALEHDARQEPGNSGGPLVTEDGRVIGVNYAGGDIGGTGVEHFYSIPTELAIPVVEVLVTGADQDSIGVNGEAFYDEESGLAGLWVSGVRAGSPASDVGLEPGDIITDLAGRPIVTDNDFDEMSGGPTKSGYCDVLRTQGADRPMAISVIRFDTGELLSGEVNNADKPLEVQQSIAADISGGSVEDDFTYQLVSDDSGQVEVEVPTDWFDVDGTEIPFMGGSWPSVAASYDLEGLYNRWDTPGIIVAAAPGLGGGDIAKALAFFEPSDCTYSSTNDYATSTMEGAFDFYYDCGTDLAMYVVGAFYDNYYEALIIVAATALTDADLTAIDHALETVYLP